MFEFDFDDLAPGGGSDAEPGGDGDVASAAENIQQDAAGALHNGESRQDGTAAAAQAPKNVEVPYAVGSWAYQGKRGITVYKVRKAGSGHLLFEGPDANGKKLAGVLQWHGRQLQAELVGEDGKPAGTICLTADEADYAMISNFRTVGKTQWGRDIRANRYFPPEGGKKPKKIVTEEPTRWEDEDLFTVHPGFIRSGGDLHVEETTLEKAKAKCQKLQNCKGFSFKGDADTQGPVTVYYKDRWSLARSATGWTSFRFEGASFKLSDMPGADVDEEILAELTTSKFSHVYVFKTPLATFPEWKKNLKVHQIVQLWHPDCTCIQLEWFVGGIHFQRKPWPWVHRKGCELVEEVTPPLPKGWFTGEGIAKVVRKWLRIHKDTHKDKVVSKDCIIFAMELVDTAGAMTPNLMKHFQYALGMQHDGWD